MIVEKALTAYLKYKFGSVLQLADSRDSVTPRPNSASTYLMYVHVPFCEELCPYCSFNRFPLDRDLAKEYFRGLQREIRMYADLGFEFSSVYVGGGTPTVLPDEMAQVLVDLRDTFSIKEISLETNPNHLTDSIVATLKDCGVNRLSVGVQSFDDGLLKQMERYHKYGSGSTIKDKLSYLIGTFDTLNVDMMFNFPTQTLKMVEKDLDVIEEIRADQVTFYPLMVSDSTKGELAARFGPISYRKEKRFYNLIRERLQRDYSCGTAWCFSRKKTMIDEYIIDYDEYVGVGSGSFGYVNGSVLANTFSVREYLDHLKKGRLPIAARNEFSRAEQIRYDFMMKLFGTSLELSKAEAKFDGTFEKTLKKEIAVFRLLGAIVRDRGILRLTGKGLYLWVIMMREFFTGVNNFRDFCRATMDAAETCVP